jgi:hypothetical protein
MKNNVEFEFIGDDTGDGGFKINFSFAFRFGRN